MPFFDNSSYEVVRKLVRRMKLARDDPNKNRGCVFVIGAGCSIQYGFPDFWTLAIDIVENGLQKRPPDWTAVEDLQDLIDRLGYTPAELKDVIKSLLPAIKGSQCPGYLRLARIASDGYLSAIMSLNFDTLLEEAFKALSAPFKVHHVLSGRRPKSFPIYKIHGSVRDGTWAPVVNLAETSIFINDGERGAAKRMLCGNHVALVGYSGADLKLHDLLRPAKARRQSKRTDNPELYIVNPGTWKSSLTHAQKDRDSLYSSLSGADAGFENFMEGLEELIHHAEHGGMSGPTAFKQTFRSRADQRVIAAWREVALNARASFQLAEFDGRWIETHAKAVSDSVAALVTALRIGLNPPEELLLQCAAFVHDLGMIDGLSVEKRQQFPLPELLDRHGELSVKVLRAQTDNSPQLAPESYSPDSRKLFKEMVYELCKRHSTRIEPASLSDSSFDDSQPLVIAGFTISVRIPLLVALLCAADEMCGSAQFPRVLDWDYRGSMILGPIDDPILHVLTEESAGSRFEVRDGTIQLARASDAINPPVALKTPGLGAQSFFLERVKRAVKALNDEARRIDPGNPGLKVDVEQAADARVKAEGASPLEEPLSESLTALARKVPPGVLGEADLLLDLLTIYGLPVDERIQRVRPESAAFREVHARVMKLQASAKPGLRSRYFEIRRSGPNTPLEKWFVDNVNRVLYPAVQFLARTLDARHERLSMLLAITDFGGTLLRGEVQRGVRGLVDGFVSRVEDRHVKDRKLAHGHNQCILCTSRLLRVAASIVERHDGIWSDTDESVSSIKEMDTLMSELIAFLAQPDLTMEDFLGFPREKRKTERLRSVRYLAQAVRATHVALRARSRQLERLPVGLQKEGIASQVKDLSQLCEKLWNYLNELKWKDIQTFRDEEPETLTMGDVALAWADPAVRSRNSQPPLWAAAATDDMTKRFSSDLDAIYLWPAMLYTAGDQETQEWANRMVKRFHRYAGRDSILWIPDPRNPYYGSWGYNAVNTRRVSTSLVAFWQRVLECPDLFEKAFRA
jgi:hypothetical protein